MDAQIGAPAHARGLYSPAHTDTSSTVSPPEGTKLWGGEGGRGGEGQQGERWCIIQVGVLTVQCNVLYVCVAPHVTMYIAACMAAPGSATLDTLHTV